MTNFPLTSGLVPSYGKARFFGATPAEALVNSAQFIDNYSIADPTVIMTFDPNYSLYCATVFGLAVSPDENKEISTEPVRVPIIDMLGA